MGLEVDITKKFKGFELNVKFNADNEVSGLLGASGSGKSMTLRCISGIETPEMGKIVLNNRVLFDSEKKINVPIRQRRVGFLFQNYALFPNMTIEQNIGFGLSKNINKLQKNNIIMKEIEAMQLDGLEKRYPYELSGGQQQRAALARAFVVKPEILLLDEPFSALDEYLRNHMIKQLKEDIAGFSGTTIFVTHNMDEAYQVCENIIILSNGKIDISGYKEDVFNKPETVSSAKLTGCKNISRAKKADSKTIEAIDWGIKVTAYDEIKDDISYVGVRAHYFEFIDKPSIEEVNTFDLFPAFTRETLFRMMVYLKFNKPAESRNDYHILWDISKEEWNLIKDKPIPWKIRINPKKVILMKD